MANQVQSFTEVLDEADHGRIAAILSKDFADLVDYLTTKADLHQDVWKGALAIDIKIAVEPNGKVELTFSRKIKRDEEKMPKARMTYDPDTREVGNGPQIRIKGIDHNEARPRAKGATAPKAAE